MLTCKLLLTLTPIFENIWYPGGQGSIYYDPSAKLGAVGGPYYELFADNETYRYLTKPSNAEKLVQQLDDLLTKHRIDVDEKPEKYL